MRYLGRAAWLLAAAMISFTAGIAFGALYGPQTGAVATIVVGVALAEKWF